MQIDLRTAELPAEALRAEVCIVGAGIAGLTLAQKLAEQGIDVILLEAGSLTPDPAALRSRPDPPIKPTSERQNVVGRIAMEAYRHPGSAEPACEAFGGTSLTWGGQLLPLHEEAGTESIHRPASAWPVNATELMPYVAEAEKILGVDELPYEGRGFFDAVHTSAPSLFAGVPGTTLRLSKFTPFSHRNLARTLGRDLLAHRRVRVLFHARASELLMNSSGQEGRRHVEAVLLRRPDGQSLRVEATEFVVAAGTLESVWLLLASRSAAPAGVGNPYGQLGRNLHDHLTLTAAVFEGAARDRVLEQLRPWMIRGPQGTTVHGLKLEASPALRAELGLHPVMAHLTVEEREDSPLGTLRATLRERQGRGTTAALIRGARPFAPVLLEAARLAWSAWRHKRRYVSRHAEVALRLNCAQLTPSDSRITLSEKRDEHGEPKPILSWRIDGSECLTLIRFAAFLRRYFDEAAIGAGTRWTPTLFPRWTACMDEPDSESVHEAFEDLIHELTDARHLMGGAVMGTDPRSSVVDPELCVHGVSNLHVASLAVFPNGSAQLPTLTLMALSLRLADRLASSLRKASASE